MPVVQVKISNRNYDEVDPSVTTLNYFPQYQEKRLKFDNESLCS